MGIMRVRADRAENFRKLLRYGKYLWKFSHARADRDDATDAGGPRMPDNGVQLAGKIGKIQVAVAIHQHFQAFASGST